ncbi:MAG: cysteine--tRNA ligase, partial [Chloroflexota bacterium]|nr:cysteine--tRNA ligase [Chloroflexota bacterium]
MEISHATRKGRDRLALQLYDTATRNKRDFVPREDVVRMYVCGMTPKDPPHIGHARLFVHADVMRRYLEHRGYRVQHVQNFTDVDDKIIDRAKERGVEPLDLAQANSEAYFEVMDKLGVRHAHTFPRVSEHVEAIVGEIQTLIDKGIAYETSNGVYFEVGKWPDYGRLSGRTAEDVMAGARIEVDEEKHDPRDFALWKRHKSGEIFWDSPWGKGRPGWHIECSSMIRQHLGPRIDVHWGGSDLLFPHHENELAQAEAGFGTAPFVNHWLHLGVLRINGEKMGHSVGNFVTLETLFEEFPPAVVRFYLVSTPYGSVVDFTGDSLAQAAAAFDRMIGALRAVAGSGTLDTGSSARVREAASAARTGFDKAMDDDLNVSAAWAAAFDWVRDTNRKLAAEERAGPEAHGVAVVVLRRGELRADRLGPHHHPLGWHGRIVPEERAERVERPRDERRGRL